MTKRTEHSLNGWTEIFRAGTHTASNGETAIYSTDDLDQVVANHSENDAAPIVIGHPQHNDPAYGWTAELKRDGDSLFAKFKDVAQEFAQAVDDGRYRKRSVRLIKNAKGWMLGHVGYLGAKRPALSLDLAGRNYAEPDGDQFDFEMDSYTPGVVARFLRSFREWFIEKEGVERADQVIPDYQIDSLNDHVTELRKPREDEPSPSFTEPNQPDEGDTDMPEFTQADIDAARQAGRDETSSTLQQSLEKERNKNRRRDFQADMDKLIDAGRMTPAQAEGAVDFMMQLDAGDDAVFEFSAGEGDKAQTIKTDPTKWFSDFMAKLPVQVDMGRSTDDEPGTQAHDYAAPVGTHVDADRLNLHNKALDYQAKHAGVDYITAVKQVENQGG